MAENSKDLGDTIQEKSIGIGETINEVANKVMDKLEDASKGIELTPTKDDSDYVDSGYDGSQTRESGTVQ